MESHTRFIQTSCQCTNILIQKKSYQLHSISISCQKYTQFYHIQLYWGLFLLGSVAHLFVEFAFPLIDGIWFKMLKVETSISKLEITSNESGTFPSVCWRFRFFNMLSTLTLDSLYCLEEFSFFRVYKEEWRQWERKIYKMMMVREKSIIWINVERVKDSLKRCNIMCGR